MATCPICKSSAEEIEPGSFDGTTFRCPKHGEFDVTRTVLAGSAYTEADEDKWERALQIARAGAAPDKRPRISSYHF